MRRFVGRLGLAFALIAMNAAVAATTVDDLFNAAAIDDARNVRRIVAERLVDPTALDAKGDTLLIAAIRADASKVASLLIDDPTVDVEAPNVTGETPLMIAAYRNNRAVAEKLVARGAEVNKPGWTALHYAASVDAGAIVDLLLEHFAYIDAESPNKTTPLMMAARGGHSALARHLVDAGADPTPVNQRDLTAADFARRANEAELAVWLDAQSSAWRAKYGVPPSRRPP